MPAEFSRNITALLRNFRRAVDEMTNTRKFLTKNGKIRLIFNGRVYCPVTAAYRRVNGTRVNLAAINNLSTMSNISLNGNEAIELYRACDTTEDTPLRKSLLEIAGLNNAVPTSAVENVVPIEG